MMGLRRGSMPMGEIVFRGLCLAAVVLPVVSLLALLLLLVLALIRKSVAA